MSDHYAVDFQPGKDEWWPSRCACGADFGGTAVAQDAIDMLMDHAYTEGIADAREFVRREESK